MTITSKKTQLSKLAAETKARREARRAELAEMIKRMKTSPAGIRAKGPGVR